MLFGFVEASQAAPTGFEQQQQQQFTWEGSWADALGNSLGLATQLVLNPGFGGPAVNYLMQEVIPEGFVAAATAAAADAAAGDSSAADVSSSTVSRASGVDVVQAAGQLQVQRQLLALTFWQRYAGLEERYQAWKQTRSSAVLSAGVEPGTLGSLEDAVQLLQEMLILAGADALRLPAPQWLAERVGSMAEGEEGAGAAAAVAEGEWLCMPQYDAPVNPLMLAAYAGERVDGWQGVLRGRKHGVSMDSLVLLWMKDDARLAEPPSAATSSSSKGVARMLIILTASCPSIAVALAHHSTALLIAADTLVLCLLLLLLLHRGHRGAGAGAAALQRAAAGCHSTAPSAGAHGARCCSTRHAAALQEAGGEREAGFCRNLGITRQGGPGCGHPANPAAVVVAL
jgi:hypothetical protein